MGRLIQMGKEYTYEGQNLQDYVKQQQDYARAESHADRDFERDIIAQQEQERVDKDRDMAMALARIAAQDKDKELEEATIEANERLEMVRIENTERQTKTDREMKFKSDQKNKSNDG